MKTFIVIALLMLSAFCYAKPKQHGSSDIDELRGLVFNNAKIPIYQNGELQMMIFTNSGERQGNAINGKDVVLEILRNEADVDVINDGWNTRPYFLKSPLIDVLGFWRRRHVYSQAVITTANAIVDQQQGKAIGELQVFLRSPSLDLNGIGFEINFKTHTIQVNSDVHIVLRDEAYDPIKIYQSGKTPSNYSFTKADCDTLLIDSTKDQIMLIGHVVVVHEGKTIESDRLTIFMDKSKPQTGDEGTISGTKISRILADQNVTLTDENNQKVYCDHLLYRAANRSFMLCGDNPDDGSVVPDRQVRFNNKDNRFNCDEMYIFLQSGNQNVDRAKCKGNVNVATIDKQTGKDGSTLSANLSDYYPNRNMIVFTGDVKVRDGENKLDCERMDLFLEKGSDGNNDQIIGASGGHKLKKSVSIGHVHMVDGKSVLDTDKLTLYFRDARENEKVVRGMMHTGKSQLSVVECDGHVTGTSSDNSDGNENGLRKIFCDYLRSEQDTNYTEMHGNVIAKTNDSRLDCAHMYIYNKATETMSEEKRVRSLAADDNDFISDIDDDPFEIVNSENHAPSRIVISDNRNLEKILCEDNVAVTNRQPDGQLVRAEGDHGIYKVADRRFVITSDEPNYSRLRSGGRAQYCDYINYDLVEERFNCGSSTRRTRYTARDRVPIPEI